MIIEFKATDFKEESKRGVDNLITQLHKHTARDENMLKSMLPIIQENERAFAYLMLYFFNCNYVTIEDNKIIIENRNDNGDQTGSS